MAIELVTGWHGEDHITAAQEADRFRGSIGCTGRLNVGSLMMPTALTANQISIADGVCLIDGRECYIGYGETCNVEIESGTQDQYRNDLIVITYSKGDDGVESVDFEVIEGTPDAESPVDPSYSDTDIRTGMFTSQKAFCRVRLDGVNIEGIDMLMDILPSMEELNTGIMQNNYSGAGVHNAIYRGKYLGDQVTDEQYAAIKAGTFDDLYIGDYWTIGGINWRIAAFDYYYQTGSNYSCTDHHVVIVPDTRLYTATMNDPNTTAGGYVGSLMFTTNLADAKSTVNGAFGSGHVLTHEVYLTNAVTSGYPTGGEWIDVTVDLMNEEMVYGCPIRQQMSFGGTGVYGGTIEKSQLPLFRLAPRYQNIRQTYWLRDIYSATAFCYCGSNGYAGSTGASSSSGVRPAFCIYSP